MIGVRHAGSSGGGSAAALPADAREAREREDLAEQRRPEDPRGVTATLGALVPRRCPPCPDARAEQAEQRTQQRAQLRLGLSGRLRWLGPLEQFHPIPVEGEPFHDVLLALFQLDDLVGQLLLSRRQLTPGDLGLASSSA